jgi:hypothetical protein
MLIYIMSLKSLTPVPQKFLGPTTTPGIKSSANLTEATVTTMSSSDLQPKEEYINCLVSVEDLDPEETCPICQENFISDGHGPVLLECKHLFGRGCLVQWLQDNNSCPMCRRTLYASENEEENEYYGGDIDALEAAIVEALTWRVGYVADMGEYILLNGAFAYERLSESQREILIEELMDQFIEELPQALPDELPPFSGFITIDESTIWNFVRSTMLPHCPVPQHDPLPDLTGAVTPIPEEFTPEDVDLLRASLAGMEALFHELEDRYKAEIHAIESARPQLPAEVEHAFQSLRGMDNCRRNIETCIHRLQSATKHAWDLLLELASLRDTFTPLVDHDMRRAYWRGLPMGLVEEIRFLFNYLTESLVWLPRAYKELMAIYKGL